MSEEKSDLLLADTAQEIITVLEVPHAFPKKFAPAAKREGFWRRAVR